MNNITSYCIELTPGQLDYLAGGTRGQPTNEARAEPSFILW